ncbi:hypothetical protein [Xanthomonas euvesicatoria]|uniref:hypothetical protein n=1 Tax=Xanthomonas euvesicatoria TaxID=456327 RepID=UPI001E658C93|nr:hypothetical protein [Xanthomonas euvesicatoria]
MKLRWYFIPWLTYASLLVLLRFTFVGPSEALATAYGFGSLLVLGIPCLIGSARIRRELEATDRNLWEQLTHFPGLGPGAYNDFATLAWITQPASSIPEHVKPQWLNARRLSWIPLAWFLTGIPMIMLLTIGHP